MNSYVPEEKLRLTWNHRKVHITAFANLLWFNDFYSTSVDYMSQLNLRYGLEGVVHIPYNWTISSDFSLYTRRGYYTEYLNGTDIVWNAKVTKSILKGGIIFALDAYDILHQISNISYVNNTQYRVESITNGVPAFFLLHVQFRFNKQPSKRNG